jgi:hypothetical protein
VLFAHAYHYPGMWFVRLHEVRPRIFAVRVQNIAAFYTFLCTLRHYVSCGTYTLDVVANK